MTYGMYSHDIIEDFFWIALNEREIPKLAARLNHCHIHVFIYYYKHARILYCRLF